MKINLKDVMRCLEVGSIDDCYYVINEDMDNINIVEVNLDGQIDKYNLITEFAKTIENDQMKKELTEILNGYDVNRKFEAYCSKYQLEDKYPKFKEEKLKQYISCWAKENDIELVS